MCFTLISNLPCSQEWCWAPESPVFPSEVPWLALVYITRPCSWDSEDWAQGLVLDRQALSWARLSASFCLVLVTFKHLFSPSSMAIVWLLVLLIFLASSRISRWNPVSLFCVWSDVSQIICAAQYIWYGLPSEHEDLGFNRDVVWK